MTCTTVTVCKVTPSPEEEMLHSLAHVLDFFVIVPVFVNIPNTRVAVEVV